MSEAFYQDYLDELRGIKPCTDKEREELLGRLASGDQEAKKRLIEGHLIFALALAKDFRDQGVLASDLVQEANLALTMAVSEYAGGDFLEMAKERILSAVQAAVRERKQEEEAGQALVTRVNDLQETAKKMAEELGREASVEELAQRMGMPCEEVKETMKMAVDALKIIG